MQVLVGDFTRRSTGDVLLHEATVRNQATSVLDLFAQDGNGRMLRVQSPTTGQWTGPVPGPRFLSGTPIAVPAGQDPAAIVQPKLAAIAPSSGSAVDGPGERAP